MASSTTSVPPTPWDRTDAGSEETGSAMTSAPVLIAAKDMSSNFPESQTVTDGKETQSNETRPTTPPKRLACDACRERKVRCNKQHPKCARCARLGHNCNYSGPSKQSALKNDLSQVLMTLHSRLVQAQAEAQLALSGSMLNIYPLSIPWTDQNMSSADSMPTVPTVQCSPINANQDRSFQNVGMLEGLEDSSMVDDLTMHGSNEWLNSKLGDNPFCFDSMASTISSDLPHPILDAPQVFGVNPSSHETSLSSSSINAQTTGSETSRQNSSRISASIYTQLHTVFFEIFYPVLPIVNQSRFEAEVAQGNNTISSQALSNAIAALGSLATPELIFAHEVCYEQASDLLDRCERQENGSNLVNINTLQACVLLTLCEFKRTNFARAWMTLGRAIRLARMMSLDRADSSVPNSGLIVLLPPALNPAELEERRRTFWLIYVLDAFAGIRTNSAPVIDDSHTLVPLPCPEELSDITEPTTMLSLHQFAEFPEQISLSSFAGTVVMISLHRRCVDHIHSSLHEEALYPFWVTHYRLDKAIKGFRKKITQHNSRHPGAEEPLSLTLQMNLAAVEISLHETAVARVELEQLPPTLLTDALKACQTAANDIIGAVRSGQLLTGKSREAFRQSSPFFVWPLTMAIQACLRLLSCSSDTTLNHIDSLHFLSDSMRELVELQHLPMALLEEANGKILEVERPRKRSRVEPLGVSSSKS